MSFIVLLFILYKSYLWSRQFFTPEWVVFYFLELLMIYFISHMSTSQTHFSWKGQWLWCERESNCDLSGSSSVSPLWSLESIPFSCHDFSQRGLWISSNSFSTKVEKISALKEIRLSIWGFAILTFQQVLIYQSVLDFSLWARAFLLLYSLALLCYHLWRKSPSENIFLYNKEDFQKSKICKVLLFQSLKNALLYPMFFIFFLNDSILFALYERIMPSSWWKV